MNWKFFLLPKSIFLFDTDIYARCFTLAWLGQLLRREHYQDHFLTENEQGYACDSQLASEEFRLAEDSLRDTEQEYTASSVIETKPNGESILQLLQLRHFCESRAI